MTDADPHDTPSDKAAEMTLSRWQRVLVGSAGIAACGSGGLATFWTSNQLGAAGLMVLGGVAGLAAGSGHLPTRLTWGDKSVDIVARKQAERAAATANEVSKATAAIVSTQPDKQKRSVLDDVVVHNLDRQNALRPLAQDARRGERAVRHVENAMHYIDGVLIKPDIDDYFDIVIVAAENGREFGFVVRVLRRDWSPDLLQQEKQRLAHAVRSNPAADGAYLLLGGRVPHWVTPEALSPENRIGVFDGISSLTDSQLARLLTLALQRLGWRVGTPAL